MALRDALKKTKYEGDPVAQATEVPMYYESQEDLNPDIKELVNALVQEQLTLVEAANAKQKEKMRYLLVFQNSVSCSLHRMLHHHRFVIRSA